MYMVNSHGILEIEFNVDTLGIRNKLELVKRCCVVEQSKDLQDKLTINRESRIDL